MRAYYKITKQETDFTEYINPASHKINGVVVRQKGEEQVLCQRDQYCFKNQLNWCEVRDEDDDYDYDDDILHLFSWVHLPIKLYLQW
jgi:hypothetical protein